MQYEIKGESLPVLKCQLSQGESIQCEAGAMSWMDDGIEMQTEAGGLGKMFGRLLTGENMFLNTYVANRAGEIAFASKFPGSIRAIEKETCPPCLRGSGSGDAAVNDMPGECQSRGVTEPQREGSKADRGILHGESE